jgi:hypothetical protein
MKQYRGDQAGAVERAQSHTRSLEEPKAIRTIHEDFGLKTAQYSDGKVVFGAQTRLGLQPGSRLSKAQKHSIRCLR